MNDATPLPAQFDPAKTALTGIEVLRHGLPPVPAVLTRRMSVPVAFWTAAHSAVVLFLQYEPDGFGSVGPMVLMGTFARMAIAGARTSTGTSTGGAMTRLPIRAGQLTWAAGRSPAGAAGRSPASRSRGTPPTW